MADQIKFTEAYVRSRECPKDRPSVSYRDTGGSLYLWVSRKSKSFRYRYRFNGGATQELNRAISGPWISSRLRPLARRYRPRRPAVAGTY